MVAIESARASILDALGLQREAAGVALGGSFSMSSDGQVIESTDPTTGEAPARVRAAAVPGWGWAIALVCGDSIVWKPSEQTLAGVDRNSAAVPRDHQRHRSWRLIRFHARRDG
jgi:hypothetical protein